MFDAPQQNQVLPNIPDPPKPPPLLGAPQGKKPGKKSQTPTFLGAEAAPASGDTGSKTLLGQ